MKKNANFRALTHKNFDLWPESLQFSDGLKDVICQKNTSISCGMIQKKIDFPQKTRSFCYF